MSDEPRPGDPAGEQPDPTIEFAAPGEGGPGPGAQPASDEHARKGSMRSQDPSTSVPRPPSVAEQRERERVRAEAEAAQAAAEQAAADDAARRVRRRRVLVGSGVGVGVVAVVAALYLHDRGDRYTDAHCVDDQGVVVADSNCSGSGGYFGGPGFIFIGSGGRHYQYYYGGSGSIGQKATGGSLTPSNGTKYANSSGNAVKSDGTTGGAVSRGGFGVKSGGSDGGGKSGGSSGGGKSGGS